MPRSRERGGTRMPWGGEDTTRPPMLISPPVGCSSPATQRNVVVLPQPEGPSRTTISPAGTAKLTPSMAGRPIANCLRRSVTSRVAVMIVLPRRRSLPVTEDLVPIGDPVGVQLHILFEIWIPDLDHLGIEAFRIDRATFNDVRLPCSLIMKVWPSFDRHQLRYSFAALGCAAVFGIPVAYGWAGTPSSGKTIFTGAPSSCFR